MISDKPSISKGLDAIFGVKNSKVQIEHINIDENTEQIVNIEIVNILPNSQQPRKSFDDVSLTELARSIEVQGVLQPLIVRRINGDKYQIIAGERRWRAALLAKLKNIPVIVRNVENKIAAAYSLIENIQRENLNSIEVAFGIQELLLNYQLTHEEIAQSIGLARSSVTNILRLLELEEEVRILLQEKKLSMGHARALLGMNRLEQIKVAQLIFEKDLSVRQVEALIKKLKQRKNTSNEIIYEKEQLEKWKQQLSLRFQSNVNIQINQQGKSRVVVSFNSMDELNRFVENVKF